MSTSTLSEKIGAVQDRLGLDDYTACGQLGISVHTLRRWKKKGNEPSFAGALKLCNEWNLDARYLFGQSSKPFLPKRRGGAA